MKLPAVLLLFSLPATAAPFPAEFHPRPAKVVKAEAPEGVAFAWRTAHYHFHSDTAIPAQQMQRFATTMEAVPQLLKTLPLPLFTPPGEKPLVIHLCKDADRFEELGGPVGGGGYYEGRRHRILLRADKFLTAPSLQPSRLQPRPNEDLLVHEVCHAHMSWLVRVGRPWITEGLAEFFAAAHMGGGRFQFDDQIPSIRDHLKRNQPTAPDGSMHLPGVDYLAKLDNKRWIEDRVADDPQNTYTPYAVSLLMVHYYLNGGAERREEFTDHLDDLQAYRSPRQRRPELVIANPKEVQEQLQKFWSPRGLRLRFPK